MENVVHALERPSADRKYKKVDNDGNNEEKGSNNAFQKVRNGDFVGGARRFEVIDLFTHTSYFF
jgi:hypothetical protein